MLVLDINDLRILSSGLLQTSEKMAIIRISAFDTVMDFYIILLIPVKANTHDLYRYMYSLYICRIRKKQLCWLWSSVEVYKLVS